MNTVKHKTIFHVDMDAFYASIEIRDNPSLKGKPVIVGAAPGNRGVVSACSYEARRYGIHSAMPVSRAYRKCPHGIFLPVRMKRYIEVSAQIMDILKSFTPDFQQISVDEAFLDLSGTRRLLGPPEKIANKIKNKIKKEYNITLSVGIAPNRYLAKLASEADKPDGLFIVYPGKEEEFLDTLKLKDLWSVGKKTLQRLEELNIINISRLRAFSIDILKSMLGEGTSNFLYNAVRGIDPGIHSQKPKSHSISNEITFEKDCKDKEYIKKVLLEISFGVMGRLLNKNMKSRTLFVKIRYEDFTTTSIQKTLDHNITSSEEMYKIALDLFFKRWNGFTPLRLIGLGVSDVINHKAPEQLELFSGADSKKKKLEETISSLKKKMTDTTITKASLLKNKKNTT